MSNSAAMKEQCVLTLFEKFISDSRKGKRLQPNGKKIAAGTVNNYQSTLRLLKSFSDHSNFKLRLVPWNRLTSREKEREKNYWKKFYKSFSAYLYDHLKCYDNYVGMCIKNIKVFFNYLQNHLNIDAGGVQKLFYVRKEEIAIFPLMPEELNYLIYDKDFEGKLTGRLRQIKDVFVFGCTVALRFSDLSVLRKANLRVVADNHYLAVKAKKTSVQTLVKLPDYAIEILNRHKGKQKTLLPLFSLSYFNEQIKRLLEKAGLTHPVLVSRERRGEKTVLKSDEGKGIRFCDIASTHSMRRTAISTMLCLGMKEQMVRRISGHSPNSKEFYRYVSWAQAYQDQESKNVFQLLKAKKLLP